jgi:hypothetical protein
VVKVGVGQGLDVPRGRVADVGDLANPTVHQRGTVLQRLIQTAYRLDLAARSISCNKFWWSCIIIEVC